MSVATTQTTDRLITSAFRLIELAEKVNGRFLHSTGAKLADAARLIAEAAGEIKVSCSKYEQAAMDPKHDFYYPPDEA